MPPSRHETEDKPFWSTERLSYAILGLAAAFWAIGFLVFGTLVVIEWADDGWSLHGEFGRVTSLFGALVLAAGGGTVAAWCYREIRPEPRDRGTREP